MVSLLSQLAQTPEPVDLVAKTVPFEALLVGLLPVYFMLYCCLILIGLGFFIFHIYMLVDAIKRDYKNPDDKLIWVLAIIFVGYIGSIIYYFAIKRKDNN